MCRYKGNITGYPDDEYTMPATPGVNTLFSLSRGINVDDKVESQKVKMAMALEDSEETWDLIKDKNVESQKQENYNDKTK